MFIFRFLNGELKSFLTLLNVDSGKIKVVYSFDDKKFQKKENIHPITNKRTSRFGYTYVASVGEVSKKMHHQISVVRAIDWGIAISSEGPVCIEGNPEWAAVAKFAPWFTPKDLNNFLENLNRGSA